MYAYVKINTATDIQGISETDNIGFGLSTTSFGHLVRRFEFKVTQIKIVLFKTQI